MEKRTFVCRNCASSCPILITVEDGQVQAAEGDHEAPLYRGYTCPKGRAIPQQYHNPGRLLHSLKRLPDGSHVPISSEQLVEEVAVKMGKIIDESGPQAIATLLGNGVMPQPVASGMMLSFLAGIGSPMLFSPGTLDQPGLVMSKALHGDWQGGRIHPDLLEAVLLVGGNPVVSKQHFPTNPAWRLKEMTTGHQGMKLVVIDPRKTETARRAAVHLQAIPGEDPTILAGLLHLLLEMDGIDHAFVEQNTVGIEALRDAVAAFTPEYVAKRAGLGKDELIAAARVLIEAGRGDTASGVGPSMATRGTLFSYLALCIQTVRGWWAREGDPVSRPKVLLPRRDWRAQPIAPQPAWGFGLKTSVRGLQQTVAGMPIAALPDLIRTDAPDRVRALVTHGGAYHSLPDTSKTVAALKELDLMVAHDVELTPTAALAHYVIATVDQLETPAISVLNESVGDIHPGYDWTEPYAYYRPAAMERPEGSDLMESWQIYYRVAQKLGIDLSYIHYGGANGAEQFPIDMVNEPSTDDIFEIMCSGSTIPLSEVKKHPHGAIFPEARDTVRAAASACDAKLQLADPDMLASLHQVRSEDPMERRATSEAFPLLLICRRVMHNTNSAFRTEGIVPTKYNPLWMHPEDLSGAGLVDGAPVLVTSRHGEIAAYTKGDDTLRRGVVAMTQGFGRRRIDDYHPARDGANINEILSWLDDPDEYHGMPRMSALPVQVSPSVA